MEPAQLLAENAQTRAKVSDTLAQHSQLLATNGEVQTEASDTSVLPEQRTLEDPTNVTKVSDTLAPANTIQPCICKRVKRKEKIWGRVVTQNAGWHVKPSHLDPKL